MTAYSIALRCSLCEIRMVYKRNNGSSSLINHVNVKHKSVYAAYVGNFHGKNTNRRKKKKTSDLRIHFKTTPYAANSDMHKHLIRNMISVCCKSLRPFSIFDCVWMKKLLGDFDPRLLLPSRKHFTEVMLPALAKQTKDSVVVDLRSARFVSISFDL